MFKTVYMLKKRSDMTLAEFIERYESGHAPLGVKYVTNALHYQRRYLEPGPSPFTGSEPDFDVITEIWYENREEMELAMAKLADPEIYAEIEKDEEELFDRSASRVYVVADERWSIRFGF